MPALTCSSTTWRTARSISRSSWDLSIAAPSSRATRRLDSASLRGRLPTWVVRMRSLRVVMFALEFSDQGADVGFVRDWLGGFWVVGRELRLWLAESREDGAATLQCPPARIFRAVRPSRLIAGQGTLARLLPMADFEVEFGQIHVSGEF